MDAASDAQMVPMLPCRDVDLTAEFWTALGLTVAYHQLRPNPYVALERGGIVLHYYGLHGLDPDANHGTCAIIVGDTEPLHALFTAGLTARYGRIPLRGLPRITRPRRRADNAGLSGFSVVDPDGNWIRVSRRPASADEQPRSVDDRTDWVSEGGGPVTRSLEHAVVMADSHGDEAQAERVLAAALRRHPEVPAWEAAPALAYLAELRLRLDDPGGAAAARDALAALADRDDLTVEDREALARALREAAELAEPPS